MTVLKKALLRIVLLWILILLCSPDFAVFCGLALTPYHFFIVMRYLHYKALSKYCQEPAPLLNTCQFHNKDDLAHNGFRKYNIISYKSLHYNNTRFKAPNRHFKHVLVSG